LASLLLTTKETSAQSAQENLQLQLGESIAVYSEKAYRKNNGTYFEAVGNVVILSGNDTIYGEKASLDMRTGSFTLEGSIRMISQGITIYGSYAKYTGSDSKVEIKNARVTTSDFSIVAAEITRVSENRFIAKKAEYTTCKDCTESWSVFGEELDLEIGKYAHLKHAFTKVKGVNVLYFPYLILPVKNSRESGILFPAVYTRFDEGLAYEQPFFWAINDSEDATITPTFLAARGFGHDIEYRRVFDETGFLEVRDKRVYDTIYLPGKADIRSKSGESYTRFFTDLEYHKNFGHNINQHLSLSGLRDMDFIVDYNFYTDERLTGQDNGVSFFTEFRDDFFMFDIESHYRQNLLFNNPIEFDDSYIQVLPSLSFSTVPINIIKDTPLFKNLSLQMMSHHTIFKQNKFDDTFSQIKNVARTDSSLNLNWDIGALGPVQIKTNYNFDYQSYQFLENENRPGFSKYAGVLTSEISLKTQRVFGLAYKKKMSSEEFKKKYKPSDERALEKNSEKKKRKEKLKSEELIGEIPSYTDTLTQEEVVIAKNSYRHGQEFKLVHYSILNSDESGNQFFNNQIQDSTQWFDYRDAILAEIDNTPSNVTRRNLPLSNTIEFQWNNNLIMKRPNEVNAFADRRFLRDNFNYNKIGYFNLSQGVDLRDEIGATLDEKLTRLRLEGGFTGANWSLGFQQFYFHQTSDEILAINFQRQMDTLNLLLNYEENSFPESNKELLRFGFQVRPLDAIGFSLLQEYDLRTDENIRTIYQVDLMPNNNCWIINLNYRDSIVAKQFALNFVFNFGDESFSNYRNNFWSFNRLGQ
jgi:LPS-assembly protein